MIDIAVSIAVGISVTIAVGVTVDVAIRITVGFLVGVVPSVSLPRSLMASTEKQYGEHASNQHLSPER